VGPENKGMINNDHELVPNLVVAHHVCEYCLLNEISSCGGGCECIKYEGVGCTEKFCDWLFEQAGVPYVTISKVLMAIF
jgi:hypothetical protein